jgi:LysM repeat protein
VALGRLAAIAMLAVGLAGCSFGLSPDLMTTPGPSSGRRDMPGHVYLLRGLIGDIFSLGMDDLAEKIRQRGIRASVHGVSAARVLADAIIAKYRSEPSLAPIVLIGHSTGGDEIIVMAERLKAANVPVALAVGFDPTPIARDVPSNVELFINLYQATNLIGGGRATPGPGFRGRLINVDLRDRREIVHITLDKSKVLHDLLIEKIVAIAEASALHQQTRVAAPAAKRKGRGTPEAETVRPLVMKYVVPSHEPIRLWDSAWSITPAAGDTLDSISAKYGAPAWAIAQVNNLDERGALPRERRLLIPYSIDVPGRVHDANGTGEPTLGAARALSPALR